MDSSGVALHVAACLLLILVTRTGVDAVDWDIVTPLDDYVHRFDPHSNWVEIDNYDANGCQVHVLNMTSQMWMDDTFTEEPIWWHYLNIFVPTTPVISDAAYLFITGGFKNDSAPDPTGGSMRRVGDFCRNLGVVSAYLSTNPFQAIHFVDGVRVPRFEDLIMAHSWKLYVEDPGQPNPDINALLPMAKAGKVAMDTIQNFMAQEYTGYDIQKFMPSGFSKRGWVTWLLGCTDKRVFAMAPIVFDLLDLQRNLEHHYRGLGGWSWAFIPYWIESVPRYLYHPRMDDLEILMDPLYYSERLTMPKLVINAAGDQFFPPDGAHYFYDALPAPKFLQLWQNDEHGLSNSVEEINRILQGFFLSTYRGNQLPQITWTRTETSTTGQITVQTNPSVISIAAWSADTTIETCEEDRNNTCRRDFRITALNGPTGIVWFRSEVTQIGIDQYRVEFSKRTDFGYRGFFIEMTFPGPDGYPLRVTTEINIIPDEFPYPKCETEDECQGRLV